MNRTKILEVLKKYEAKSSHSHQPLIWSKAKNSIVFSDKGKRYIDFTSGIFVTNAGHSNITQAIIEQAEKNMLFSYSYPTEAKAKLIKKLMKMVPNYLEKVALSNTGAEAVEIACKLMRLAQVKRDKWTGRIIVSIKGSMHGKTFLGEKLRGVNEWALGHDPDFYKISHFPNDTSSFSNDMAVLTGKMHPSNIAGIILEPYRGWSARFMPKNYVKEVFKFAHKYNIPVCFDEIQGGFWRTGKLFAYEHYGVKPDLVCVGKGLGGGVPISAVLGKAELLDIADDLTSTFSGNPLSCAGALENLCNLEKIDKAELETRAGILKYTLRIFQQRHPIIRGTYSKGLLASVIFPSTYLATKCYKKAMKKGLLVVYTGKSSIKIGPPLNIPQGVLIDGLRVLELAIKETK